MLLKQLSTYIQLFFIIFIFKKKTLRFACETNSELRIISQQTLFRTIIDLKE